VLLTREGWKVGKKLVYNLYREDGQSWWRPLPVSVAANSTVWKPSGAKFRPLTYRFHNQ
jgi:hypothetical protein